MARGKSVEVEKKWRARIVTAREAVKARGEGGEEPRATVVASGLPSLA
jgi:hypothetical protein